MSIIDLRIIQYPNHDVLYARVEEIAGVDEDAVSHRTGRMEWVEVKRLHPGDDEAQKIVMEAR